MNPRKRILALLLGMVLLLSLAGCAGGGSQSAPAETDKVQESTKQSAPERTTVTAEPSQRADSADGASSTEPIVTSESSGSDILIVYFSRTGEQYNVGVIDKGNTAIVAQMIAEETGADLFEILPQEDYYPYTYDELTDVAKKEQNENARPAYQGIVLDLSAYSTVFVGAPVWWGDWPMICYTFFEENADALAGKTLIPFSTHEGSGLSGFGRKLKSAIPGTTVLDGLAIRGNDAQNNQDNVRETVKNWLSDLGY